MSEVLIQKWKERYWKPSYDMYAYDDVPKDLGIRVENLMDAFIMHWSNE